MDKNKVKSVNEFMFFGIESDIKNMIRTLKFRRIEKGRQSRGSHSAPAHLRGPLSRAVPGADPHQRGLLDLSSVRSHASSVHDSDRHIRALPDMVRVFLSRPRVRKKAAKKRGSSRGLVK